MPMQTYLCLLDLHAYDTRVAPALRRYAHNSDPVAVVQLLRSQVHGGGPGTEDFVHWADALEPDAGHKPSDQTVAELSRMLIRVFCFPQPPVALDPVAPWLKTQSDWFADLFDGGEELAGGSLEFGYGAARLYATRQQIAQFHHEVTRVGLPVADLRPVYELLQNMLQAADTNESYTLLLCPM